MSPTANTPSSPRKRAQLGSTGMNESLSCGTPARGTPLSRGSETTASTSKDGPGTIRQFPLPHRSLGRSSGGTGSHAHASRPATVSLPSRPSSRSGVSSGLTTVISRSTLSVSHRQSEERARTAGVAMLRLREAQKPRARRRPRSMSLSIPVINGTSTSPRNVNAPGSASRGRAPVRSAGGRTRRPRFDSCESHERRHRPRSGCRDDGTRRSHAPASGCRSGAPRRPRTAPRPKRPIVEIPVGRDELDVDQVAGRLPERDHRLERGDPAPRDEHELPSLGTVQSLAGGPAAHR